MLLMALLAVFFGPPTQAAPSPRAAANMPMLDPFQSRVNCPETPLSLARKQAEQPMLRRLDQLPSARGFAAVDRRIDRCPAPMLLGER